MALHPPIEQHTLRGIINFLMEPNDRNNYVFNPLNILHMRLKNIFMAVLFILVLACNQKQQKKDTVSLNLEMTETEINDLIGKWLELWKTYDLELLDDIFLQSSELTYFSSEKKGLIKGYNEMRPHHVGFGFVDGGKTPEKSLWLEDIETRMFGSTTMVAGIWYFGDKTMAKDSVQNGPVTFILEKDKNGLAKIAHTHFANY